MSGMENLNYIKKLEQENKYLYELLRVSHWFQGTEKIKETWREYLINHPQSLIDAGWFWFMESESAKKPLMCSITFTHEKGWFLYDGGHYKHPLDTFRNYWFAGPLIAPYRNVLE